MMLQLFLAMLVYVVDVATLKDGFYVSLLGFFCIRYNLYIAIGASSPRYQLPLSYSFLFIFLEHSCEEYPTI